MYSPLISAHVETYCVPLRCCLVVLWALEWLKVEFQKLQKPLFIPIPDGDSRKHHTQTKSRHKTMKFHAVSLTLKLLIYCPPFLMCPPINVLNCKESSSHTPNETFDLSLVNPLPFPDQDASQSLEGGVRLDGLVHFLLRRSHHRTATPWQVVHISLSLVAIPPFTDRR